MPSSALRVSFDKVDKANYSPFAPRGFDTSFRRKEACRFTLVDLSIVAARIPIVGRNGVDLRDRWAEYPDTYLGIAVDSHPNYFLIGGPSSGVGSGPFLAVLERQSECKLKKIKSGFQFDAFEQYVTRHNASASYNANLSSPWRSSRLQLPISRLSRRRISSVQLSVQSNVK